jgi:hypothetical protein
MRGNTVGFGTMSHNERSDAQEELKSLSQRKNLLMFIMILKTQAIRFSKKEFSGQCIS